MVIKILAHDIRTTHYTSIRDCTIARAIKREGCQLISVGPFTAKFDGKIYDISAVNNKVLGMYKTLDPDLIIDREIQAIEIEDFEAEILPIP